MTAASVILGEVRNLLQDTDASAYRWSDVELVGYLNTGQKLVAVFRPESCAVEAVHTVTDTDPRRTIPADGIKFISVTGNQTAGGARSSSVSPVAMDIIDALDETWRTTAPQSPDVDNYYSGYYHDPREPTVFWLYPRPTTGQNVYILYAKHPTVLTSAGEDLTVRPQYDPALVEFTMYKALSKEGRYTQGGLRGKEHLDAFILFLKLGGSEVRRLEAMLGAS